jgi:hypothetical protein
MKNKSFYPFERNRFFYGKLLTVRDFETEQRYFNDKRRLVNRVLFGAGVVCGLGVVATDDNSISIDSGLALDYLGREIVLPSPVTRKLSAIPGYEYIGNGNHCYLYIEYSESLKEPINAVTGGNDNNGSQYNRIEEDYSLYLKADEPSVENILDSDPYYDYKLIYDGKGLTIILKAPVAVRAGQETRVSFIILKHCDLPPIKFEFTAESEYFKSIKGESSLTFNFNENPDELKTRYDVPFIIKADQITLPKALYFEKEVNFDLYIGGEHENLDLLVKLTAAIVQGDPTSAGRNSFYSRDIEAACSGEELGICLARIDLLSTGANSIIRNIMPVPFSQYVTVNVPGGSMRAGDGLFGGSKSFTTSVEAKRLNVWEKPEAEVDYNTETNNFNFKVGIPSAQAYDYATSTGVVDIFLGNGARMNGRYISDEISHGLGLGAVSITTCLIQEEEGAMLFGNGDVFNRKEAGISPYKADTAVIVYPEKGTFKIGVKFNDAEDITILKVRWFAMKPQKDSEAFENKKEITIRIEPDIVSVKPRDEVRFKAFIHGSPNKKVSWSLKDKDSGSIDSNGIYKAASVRGTYEIIAKLDEYPEITASAFVVVNE